MESGEGRGRGRRLSTGCGGVRQEAGAESERLCSDEGEQPDNSRQGPKLQSIPPKSLNLGPLWSLPAY